MHYNGFIYINLFLINPDQAVQNRIQIKAPSGCTAYILLLHLRVFTNTVTHGKQTTAVCHKQTSVRFALSHIFFVFIYSFF